MQIRPLINYAYVIFSIFLYGNLARAADPGQQELQFTSNDVTLAGTLYLPVKENIDAAIIFVHGSGPQKRNHGVARRFANEGIATLVYDKRGVGKSGGNYEGQQSVSEYNIELLASDALAAIELLKMHPKLQRTPLGITGISQAGWIAPVAAAKHDDVDFIVLWSGPVCKVSEEDIYSIYTNDTDSDSPPSFTDALKARKSRYRWPSFLGKDTDPRESLSQLRVPGLWIFGRNDGSIPVDLSTRRLDQLNLAGHDFEYHVIPDIGHNNIDQTFDLAVTWIQQNTE